MDPLVEKRPDGHDQKFWATVGASIGLMLIVFAFLLPAESSGEISARNIAVRYWTLVLGLGLLQAALLCWLTAILLRALWFLPGRQIPSGDVLPDQDATPVLTAATRTASNQAADTGSWALIIGALPLVLLIAFIAYVALVRG